MEGTASIRQFGTPGVDCITLRQCFEIRHSPGHGIAVQANYDATGLLAADAHVEIHPRRHLTKRLPVGSDSRRSVVIAVVRVFLHLGSDIDQLPPDYVGTEHGQDCPNLPRHVVVAAAAAAAAALWLSWRYWRSRWRGRFG